LYIYVIIKKETKNSEKPQMNAPTIDRTITLPDPGKMDIHQFLNACRIIVENKIILLTRANGLLNSELSVRFKPAVLRKKAGEEVFEFDMTEELWSQIFSITWSNEAIRLLSMIQDSDELNFARGSHSSAQEECNDAFRAVGIPIRIWRNQGKPKGYSIGTTDETIARKTGESPFICRKIGYVRIKPKKSKAHTA
jgi:hypothetical protein